MPEVVIADASVLIVLENIGELEILRHVYGQLHVTPEVLDEFGKDVPDWIDIVSSEHEGYKILLETLVDKGEASVLAYAIEHKDCLLILDDAKARKLAKQLDFHFTGTLGVVHKAKQLGKLKAVKPLVDKLLVTDFRISNRIVEHILRLNNELD